MISNLNVSRRKLITFSSAAIAGLSINQLLSKAHAIEIQNSVSFSIPMLENVATPNINNPIRLNFNENALGMSPRAKQAAIDAVPKANRYAKAEMPLLNKRLAKHHKVDDTQILLTAGSSEGIRSAIAAFVKSDAQLVIPELTYGDGEHFAKIFNLKITKVPNLPDWQIDIKGIQKAAENYNGFSIVYLVNPNNPTSTVFATNEIEPWIKSKPKNTIFIIDEAYAEFVNDPDFKSVDEFIAKGYDNIILLKTFSKIHAMAGLRVGYAVSSVENIQNMAQYVAGEKLNYCGVCAALASIDDQPFLTYSKKAVDVSRQIMEKVLSNLGLHYLKSQTNFIFHQSPINLKDYRELMKQNFVLIGRDFAPATNWCRISLGTPGEMLYVANVMYNLRKNQ
ncbi:aspartate aminotransferase [Gilliamella sp. wkB18]|uniref:pyridoxal phosphate-dependent aminotransferase n=1 Tax=unclassified Gilliamella TaxID=2685620 RepID=UPI0004DCEF80|nr:histidinol-phosphate transaminase [Gilliamella apicola]KFA58843.1 Periplasmic aromatic amino acid aminotransferase beta precursor [Gilliamella apicola]OCG54933.1 aspartate aminotransferase [Gilliamella apicola]OCG64920.1 aspartate aminotransferase [Gilliamella apicola]